MLGEELQGDGFARAGASVEGGDVPKECATGQSRGCAQEQRIHPGNVPRDQGLGMCAGDRSRDCDTGPGPGDVPRDQEQGLCPQARTVPELGSEFGDGQRAVRASSYSTGAGRGSCR